MADKREALWYVVHTYSGYENKVATSIEKIVENRKLGDMILDVRIPTEKVKELKNDQEREVERKIFPSYVMVRMIMDDDMRYIVRNVRGVTGFVGSVTDPIPLTDEEVRTLFEEQETRLDLPVNVGDYVQINDEGFTAPGGGMWTGAVVGVDIETKTVKVSVDMYGNETILEVPIEDVEVF